MSIAAFLVPSAASLGVTTSPAAAASSAVKPRIAGLGSVSCPSVNVCFAVGGVGSFPQGSGVIVKTSDGGSTWKVDFNTASRKSQVILYAIDCPTTKDCEVAGIGPGDAGSVFGTTDGGVTWHRQPVTLVSEPLLAVTCSTASFCLAGGANPGTATTPVYVTSDGGETWKTFTVGRALSQIYSLECLAGSTTTCLAGGYDGSGATNFGPILKTTDGGTDWTVVANHQKPVNAISCPTSGSCEAAGGNVNSRGTTWGTTDSGNTWTHQRVEDAFDLVGVSCDSAQECVAVTEADSAWTTEDGGSTWTEHALPSPILDLRGVSCPTSGTCEGVGETNNNTAVAARTSDGGVTWSVQPLT
jgi:photosystem II stability/assembly factor-like uncharacterized protein